jgi:hypothetical protein
MASVNLPVNLGGDGNTYSDDANPTTGLANGGHRTRWIPMIIALVNMAAQVLANATAAAAAAVTAVNAPGTSGTSTSSIALGLGAKAFATQTGKAWAVGQWVNVARTSAPSTSYATGIITAYNSGTGAMTVDVKQFAGSGTFTNWTISLSAPVAQTLPVVAVTTNTTAVANTNDYAFTANAVLTLPLTPNAGDIVPFRLARDPSTLTACSLGANGNKIMGLSQDYTLDIPYQVATARYIDATWGWSIG